MIQTVTVIISSIVFSAFMAVPTYGQEQYGQEQYGQGQYGQGAYGQELYRQEKTEFPLPLLANDSLANASLIGDPLAENSRPEKTFNSEIPVPLQNDIAYHTQQYRDQCLTLPKHRTTGFIDFNSYWDTREFAVTTIVAGAKLPHDWEYFQFANFGSAFGSNSYDWTNYYTEINFRRRISKENRYLKSFDWTIQYADGSGPRGVLRLGVKWRLKDTTGPIGYFFKETLKLNYCVNFHLIETDGTGWQIEQTYRRNFCDGRFYLGGFADHNINNNSQNSAWVTEHQLGIRLVENCFLVGEYRYNSNAPTQFKSGLGVGLEYVMKFK